MKAGRKGDAAARFAEMKELASEVPLSPAELLILSGALDERSEPEKAIGVLGRILEQNPDAPEAEMARLRSAALYLKTGNTQRARELAEDHLRRNPATELRAFAEDILRRADKPAESVEGPQPPEG